MEYTQDLNFNVYSIQVLLHQELLSDVGSIQGLWARTFGGNLTNKKGPQWKLERGAFPSNLLKVEGYISSCPLPASMSMSSVTFSVLMSIQICNYTLELLRPSYLYQCWTPSECMQSLLSFTAITGSHLPNFCQLE